MTILFLADNLGMGGKERRMLELIKSLSADPKNKIILLSITDQGVGFKYMYELPITILESNRKSKFSLQPFFIIRNAVKKYQPDIVHSWGSMCSFYCLPLLPFRRFRFINSVIADAPLHLPWYNKNYLRGRITFLFSDVVLSNSLAGIRSYDAPRKKTFCIYNGIDMNRFSNLIDPDLLKQELGIQPFRFIAGMVGNFHDRKDYFTFTAAAIRMAEQHRDACFLLIGEGYNRPAVEAMVPEHLKNNIRFLGKRKDVESLNQVLTVGVLCTNSDVHGEGVSNSIIEYMSLGKPVLATEGGGTNEVIEPGINGFLLKNKNAEDLLSRLLIMYENPETCKKMGEQALKTIHQKFMLDRMTREFIAVYRGENPPHRLN